MTQATAPSTSAERVADGSPAAQRSRARRVEQAQLIVDAGRRLIVERGDRFTTQELVKEAGVALQTFYRLFAGKDQLLLAVFEDLIAESCALYEAAALELPDPVTRLRFYVTEALRTLGEGDAAVAPGSSPRSTGGCTSSSPRRCRAPPSRSPISWRRNSSSRAPTVP